MTFNIGDIAQVVQTWDAPLASVAQNVWHLKMVSGAGAEPSDLLADILTQQQVAFADIEDEISGFFEVILLELLQYNFVTHRFEGVGSLAATGIVGQSAIDYLPHGVAAVGRIVTEVAKRQGRTFVPGLTDSVVVGGLLSSGAEASLAAYLLDFQTDVAPTGGLFTWCTFNIEPLSALYETASLTSGSVIANALPGYQRRRKPLVGL